MHIVIYGIVKLVSQDVLEPNLGRRRGYKGKEC